MAKASEDTGQTTLKETVMVVVTLHHSNLPTAKLAVANLLKDGESLTVC